MQNKKCSKCQKELTADHFSKLKTSKDGLAYVCKKCSHTNYLQNKDKKREWDKKYREINKEKIAEYQKEYRKNNLSHNSVYMTEEQKEKRRIYQKEYRKINKEKIKQKEKNYRKLYEKQRIEKDELFAFKKRIRSFIGKCFNRKNSNKDIKSIDILGCDFKEFKEYLHKTFYNNYGYEYDGKEKVHIDHIIPLATAKNKEDVIKLCHYTNLQLLKPEDNIKKSDKIDFKLYKGF